MLHQSRRTHTLDFLADVDRLSRTRYLDTRRRRQYQTGTRTAVKNGRSAEDGPMSNEKDGSRFAASAYHRACSFAHRCRNVTGPATRTVWRSLMRRSTDDEPANAHGSGTAAAHDVAASTAVHRARRPIRNGRRSVCHPRHTSGPSRRCQVVRRARTTHYSEAGW